MTEWRPEARALWRRWLVWTTLAEIAGFTVPAIVGVLGADWSPRMLLPAMMLAGAVEGAMLGLGQAHVLRSVLPRINGTRFIVLTSAAASGAYFLGMSPSTFGPTVTSWPRVVTVCLGVTGGLLLLVSIGAAQWLELRQHVAGAASWVLSTGVAWLLGLAAFMVVAMPLWHPGQSVFYGVLVGLIAGLCMALVVAAATGFGLVWLLRDQWPGALADPQRPRVDEQLRPRADA